MRNVQSIELGTLALSNTGKHESLGTNAFAELVEMAESAVARLHEIRKSKQTNAVALLSRLRGTGRGVSFTRLVGEIERAHPIKLEYPFEGSDRVGGAVWIARDLLGGNSTTSVAKLCWDSRAMDLPMHVHDHSDRCIVVVRGRGYFHVTDESADEFTGKKVRTIPARERDVFLFSRGTVHTFSTEAEPMTLLSCQLPYLPFDHPHQYRLPKQRWTAGEFNDPYEVGIACDPGWTVLAECTSPISLADVLTIGL